MIIEGIIMIFVNVLGGLFGSGVAGVFIDKMFEFMDVLIPYVRVMLYIFARYYYFDNVSFDCSYPRF